MFSLSSNGADTKLMLGQLALCGGEFWVVVVDAYLYVVAVVVAMGCWFWGKCAGVSQRKY